MYAAVPGNCVAGVVLLQLINLYNYFKEVQHYLVLLSNQLSQLVEGKVFSLTTGLVNLICN